MCLQGKLANAFQTQVAILHQDIWHEGKGKKCIFKPLALSWESKETKEHAALLWVILNQQELEQVLIKTFG